MGARIQEHDFSVDEEKRLCTGGRTDIGGLAVFVGVVRDRSRGGNITKIELSHYGGMAEKYLQRIREEAIRRFGVLNVTIVHRVGTLVVAENIVCIVVAAEHRKEAFDACMFTIEELKKIVPIWKKEYAEDGESWVGSL